jgi:DNA invertase Pin-like site-specific DNA recombinase
MFASFIYDLDTYDTEKILKRFSSDKGNEMANYAYLRVSTDMQDIENQKLGILEYCNTRKLTPIEFIEETKSGRIPWADRELGRILGQVQAGDNIIVSEISRMARSTLQVLNILELAAKKESSVHIVKNGMIMDGSMQATITATILGLAAQIEREFLSLRTKEALAYRKSRGLPLGRPRGQAKSVKLDEHREDILKYLKLGVSKRSIAKIVECSPSTLYSWLKRNQL